MDYRPPHLHRCPLRLEGLLALAPYRAAPRRCLRRNTTAAAISDSWEGPEPPEQPKACFQGWVVAAAWHQPLKALVGDTALEAGPQRRELPPSAPDLAQGVPLRGLGSRQSSLPMRPLSC